MIDHDKKAAGAGRRIAGVAQSTAAASIGLLDSIDGTIDAMVSIAGIMCNLGRMLDGFLEELEKDEVVTGEYIDEDDLAISALEGAEAAARNFLERVSKSRVAAKTNCELKSEHCEALCDAYDEVTSHATSMLEAVQQVRDAIIAHDLSAEPRDTEAFASAEALIASLHDQ